MKATVLKPKVADRLHDSGKVASARETAAPAGMPPAYNLLAVTRGRRNATGMPDAVKADLEARTGSSLDDVRVTYGSSEPALYGALAFARGPQVHLGPGEEGRLPHEIAHVIQQRVGRAAPDGMEGGAPVTDSPALEREAELFAQGRTLLPRRGSAPAAPAPTIQFVRWAGSPGNMSVQTLKLSHSRVYDQLVAAVREVPPEFSEGTATIRLGSKAYEITEADCRDLVAAAFSAKKPAPSQASAMPTSQRQATSASLGGHAAPKEEPRSRLGERPRAAVGDLTSASPTGRSSLASMEESKDERTTPATGSTASTMEDYRRSLREKVHNERKTRIGFEIELALSVMLPYFKGFENFINQTLLDYAHPAGAQIEGGVNKASALPGGVLLEALLDDPQYVDAKGVRMEPSKENPPVDLKFQIEFRSTPLSPELISKELRDSVIGAIEALSSAKMFERMGARDRDASGWRGGQTGIDFLAAAQPKAAEGPSSVAEGPGFKLTDAQKAKLVQHVTSSLNLKAYVAMGKVKKMLYAHASEAQTVKKFYDALAVRLKGGTVVARTNVRNAEKQTVKSPLESMIAAEFATGIRKTPASKALGELGGAVDVGGGKSHRIPPLQATVDAIVHSGRFPVQQGRDLEGRKVERGDKVGGYLAIADKLQTPLYDETNNSLRVLVEHRTDELVDALNDILAGKDDGRWIAFVKAMRAMDEIAAQQGEAERNANAPGLD